MTPVGVFGNVLSPLIDMVIHSFALRKHKYISIMLCKTIYDNIR